MFLPKFIEKLGVCLLINPSGIYIQEMNGARFLSKQVRIGRLVLIDNTVQPEFDTWGDHSALCDRRDLLEKQIKAKSEIKKTPEMDATAIDADIASLSAELESVKDAISTHPISGLIRLGGQVATEVYKLVGKAEFKHKLESLPDGSVKFTDYSTREYFLEAMAKDLAKRYNENLESQGIESGYMDIEAARAVVVKRYNYGSSAKGKAKAKKS